MKALLLFAALTSCYLKHYPLTPSVAKRSTYMVYREDGAQGTAWAVGRHHLVTAGHICETTSNNFTIAGESRRFHARAVLWEMTHVDDFKWSKPVADLCVLHTDVELPDYLIVADRMPRAGEKVGYVGYPLGEYIESAGQYVGDVDGPATLNDDVFSAKCDHGASGSAVYHDGGVWGVLVRLRTDGEYVHDGSDGCVAVPLEPLKKILRDAGVNYNVPPELPPAIPDIAPKG